MRPRASEITWQPNENTDKSPTKERGQALLPDLETLGLAQLLSRLKPFQRRLPLNSDQLEVRKAALPPPFLRGRKSFLQSHC
jgi:hypothetical protein